MGLTLDSAGHHGVGITDALSVEGGPGVFGDAKFVAPYPVTYGCERNRLPSAQFGNSDDVEQH